MHKCTVFQYTDFTMSRRPNPRKKLLNITRIEARMDELELKKHQLARLLGINVSTLWRHLSGNHPSSLMFVTAVAKVLDLTIEEVTSDEHVCKHCRRAWVA